MDDSAVNIKDSKILMVDDTPANIDVLRKVLAMEGYKLSFATNGEKALTIAIRAVPDLILLDVMMPGIDGFEVCRRLKENEVTRDIPVIFITAKTDTEDLIEGFRAGAVDYITKPFRQEEVCIRVHTHLQTRALIRERDHLIGVLQANEQRFRLLATWSPIGIFQADIAGNYIYTNQKLRTMLGLDEEQTLGDGWLQAVHPDDRESVLSTWNDSVQGNLNYSNRFRVYTPQGTLRWVQKHASALLREDSRIDSFVGIVEDITDFKLAEEQILMDKASVEAAAQAKSEFLAGVTHELRTPLNAIIGYSEMLAEEAAGEHDVEDLEKITSASKYLLNLINNLLDLSKLEANKMSLFLEEFVIDEMIREVASTISPLVKKNNNQLKINQAHTATTMVADQTKIRQVLYNLLSNACKFTKEGIIELNVREGCRPDGQAQSLVFFEVKDNGIGLDPEQLKKLFQKYAQASSSTTRDYGGTGLGLVLSRQFCRMMGGDITVQSEAGQGSTFTVNLPLRVKTIESPAKSS